MTTNSAPSPATPSPTRRILGVSLAILAAIVIAFFVFSNLFAEFLWYDQLGFREVLTTQWLARVVMFVVGFLGMAAPIAIAIQLAYRMRPVYARLSAQLDHYQEVLEPLRRLAMWGIPAFFGFFAGFSASTQWETTWMWLNGTSTDVVDPEFGLDTGFYMFDLPFYTALVGFVSAALLVSLLVTALVSYLYGSISISQNTLRVAKAARVQLAVTAGLYVLVQAASIWLDRFRTLVEESGRITGPSYTVAHAAIPGKTILAVLAILVALLFFVTAVIGRWRFPLVATALLVVTALVVGVGYPWVVSTLQVKPNEIALESPYVERNLEMTRAAYGLDGLEKQDFKAKTDAEQGQLRADAATTASIRIIDPAIVPPAVRQLEQYRPYYRFPNVLDVDRYKIDGKDQDMVVSVRELNPQQLGQQQGWVNNTIIYTHGYGMVMAKGNQRTSDGEPVFVERGMPTAGTLTDEVGYEPRIYFGESSPTYSIVGAPAGATPVELDYPRGTDGASETKTTFKGDGGPKLDNIFTKLIYALKFQAGEILFSDQYINEKSQILYDRDPLTRVSKVAPYLTLDSDPYPSIVDGRIVWIVDGYTTSANYPYSSGLSLQQAIRDDSMQSQRLPIGNINYIRNSVKATVDAYDGSVTLYAWDDEDPVLQTWQKVYPSTLKPYSEMSADLMSHVRYPTDLFKVQRAVLGAYHVDTPQSFIQGDNLWLTPNDPNKSAAQRELQPPYYMTMKMPGQDEASYSMFTSFIPRDSTSEARNVLVGYLAVDSDAGDKAGEKAPGYGKLRMLEVNADTTVPGPGQVRNNFDANAAVSQFINLLKQGQSDVLHGNLLTLPMGGGLLYVQPVYVQSSGSTKLPRLQKVLVAFGDKIAFEDTLSEALDELFGGDAGASAGDNNTPTVPTTPNPGETPDPSATPTPTPTPETPGTGGAVDVQREAALKEAREAMSERDAAMKAGDWEKFGQADKRLTAAVQKLLDLEGQE